jgi:tetratricopeptide (TPR) repeat protein
MAATLCNLAALECYFLSRPAHAVKISLQALELIQNTGLDDSRCRLDLGWAYATLGRYQESLAHLRRALLSTRRHHDTEQEARAFGALGRTRCAMGHHRTAVALLKRAITAKRAVGNRRGAAESLSLLGTAYRGLGRYDEALACHDAALTATPEGSRESRLAILNEYGQAKSATGDVAGALSLHRQAVVEAQQIGHHYHLAKALDGIAVALRAEDPCTSRIHWSLALERYEQMGVPEALTVRQHLAELDRIAPQRREPNPRGIS